jgi:ATP phosphoribosyltransferase
VVCRAPRFQSHRAHGDPNWYAVNIIVRRTEIFKAINELRAIGGSGVVVMPLTYIFEEEPPRYMAMLEALEKMGEGEVNGLA